MHASLTKDLYFTTSTVVDWVDVFTRPEYKHIILDSLAYCQESKGLDIYAWMLMTNHLHMIVVQEMKRQTFPIYCVTSRNTQAKRLSKLLTIMCVKVGKSG